MLKTLIQTIANFGFDANAITTAFNNAIAVIENGDTGSIGGIMDMFTGVLAAFTGASTGDISAVVNSLITSVVALLSDDSTSSMLSTITGA